MTLGREFSQVHINTVSETSLQVNDSSCQGEQIDKLLISHSLEVMLEELTDGLNGKPVSAKYCI